MLYKLMDNMGVLHPARIMHHKAVEHIVVS
jgi:hypothetical protein